MLCDFAITPHSVEQSEAGSLAASVVDGVTGLLKNLLTLNAKHLVVLSDVCGGELSKGLFDLSKVLTGEADKKLLSALRKELAELGVSRPQPLMENTDEDAAIASARIEPAAQRIIVSPQYKPADTFSWRDTKDLDFYAPLFSWCRSSPKQGDVQGQLTWLTPVLARADFVVLVLPYLYARSAGPQNAPVPGGDMGFAMSLARHWRSLKLPQSGMGKSRLDIRTDRRCVDSKEPGRAPDQKRAMESLLKALPGTNVYFDGSSLSKERRLLAGVFKNGRDDYRWGVNLGHPANNDSPGSSEPAIFAPMNREDIAACASIVRSFRNSPAVTT
jgi:hypothetical protein